MDYSTLVEKVRDRWQEGESVEELSRIFELPEFGIEAILAPSLKEQKMEEAIEDYISNIPDVSIQGTAKKWGIPYSNLYYEIKKRGLWRPDRIRKKLSDEDERYIKAALSAGATVPELAAKMNVSTNLIYSSLPKGYSIEARQKTKEEFRQDIARRYWELGHTPERIEKDTKLSHKGVRENLWVDPIAHPEFWQRLQMPYAEVVGRCPSPGWQLPEDLTRRWNAYLAAHEGHLPIEVIMERYGYSAYSTDCIINVKNRDSFIAVWELARIREKLPYG